MHSTKRLTIAILAVAWLVSAPAWADGGPNAFGYAWSGRIDYDWIDTSAGTPVTLSDDSYAGPFDPGFPFFYYGAEKAGFTIGSNGIIGLGSTSGMSSLSNQCPPDTSVPNDLIALYWDDLNPAGGGVVRYFQGGAEPYRFLVVEWNQVRHYGSITDWVTMQAVLEESSNYIVLQYQDASNERGSGSSTEIKNADGTDNLLIGCKTFGYLSNSLALWIGLEGPHDLAAGPGTGSIHLSWNDEYADEDGAMIERSEQLVGPFSEIGEAGQGVTEYDDASAEECTAYWYRVRSHFGHTFYGAWSAKVNYTFPPYGPTDLTAAAISSVRIDLDWTDNSACETGTVVERSEVGAKDWVVLATIAANSESYSDETIEPGVQYAYRVKAIAPPLESAYSNEAVATAILETPTGLVAAAFSSTKIDLSWDDNSQAEDGYAIERKEASGGDFEEIANVGRDATSYRDFGLAPLTEYVFRVRAYSILTYSEYSNEAHAATLAEGDDDIDDDNDADDDTDDDGGDDDDDSDDDVADDDDDSGDDDHGHHDDDSNDDACCGS
jgi:hypothetical protein